MHTPKSTPPWHTTLDEEPLFNVNAGPEAWRPGESPLPPRMREAFDHYEAHVNDPESPKRPTPVAPTQRKFVGMSVETTSAKAHRQQRKAKQESRRSLMSRPAQIARYMPKLKAATFEVLAEWYPDFNPDAPVKRMDMEGAMEEAAKRLQKQGVFRPR
jgi:hypothetical protein